MTRVLNHTKVAGIRRRPATPASPPAPSQLPSAGFVLVYERRAFNASLHRDGCACSTRPALADAALTGTTWATLQRDPLLAKLVLQRWTIHRAMCCSDLA